MDRWKDSQKQRKETNAGQRIRKGASDGGCIWARPWKRGDTDTCWGVRAWHILDEEQGWGHRHYQKYQHMEARVLAAAWGAVIKVCEENTAEAQSCRHSSIMWLQLNLITTSLINGVTWDKVFSFFGLSGTKSGYLQPRILLRKHIYILYHVSPWILGYLNLSTTAFNLDLVYGVRGIEE